MQAAPIPLQEAAKIAEEFKNFTYIVSHDLSAPLRAIVEFSKLLKTEQSDVLSEEGKLYLSLIVESGEKMQRMMSGLLDFSRLNTMAKPLKKVQAGSALENALIVMEDRVKATKAKVEALPLPAVNADIDTLMQLFMILIDNALKFHKPDEVPYIRISAQQQGEEIVFTVRDKGIGIEPQFYERIFHPFQRLHSDKEYPGIGMGLALAKKIVDRHLGRIWCEAGTQTGISFHFAFPAIEVAS